MLTFKNFQYKLVAALVAAEILSTFEISMAFAALRFMIQDFGSPSAVGWTITAFLLSGAVSAAIFGRIGDMYGRKRVLLLVLAISVTGSLIASLWPTLSGVIIGRIVQGAAGGIFPLCAGILREQVDSKVLPIYLGILSAILTVSAGLGLLVGGLLVDTFTWHWIFYVNAAIGIFAWFAVAVGVPTGARSKLESGTNYLGGILFVPAVVMIMLGLKKSGDWGWDNAGTLGLVAGGLIVGTGWVWSELRASKPLMHIRLLKNRELLLVVLCAALLGLTWNQFQQIWSILLQQPVATGEGLGLSASMSGLILQPQTLMALVGGPVAGWFAIRYGIRISMAFGTLLLSASWVAAAINHTSIPFILLLMVTMGISSAFLYAMLPIIIARVAPMDRTSEAIGMMTVVRGTASGIGAQVVAGLLTVSTVADPQGGGFFPDRFSYQLAMGYIAGGIFIVFVLYLFLSAQGEGRAPSAGEWGDDATSQDVSRP
ncbi:MFS transporter [Pseudomaricurvus sp. HS19]|uniref:MFS transporter n=1 Tax=Pseudomaricurvus sp. HS19 TaxID=2692626 RepID=UPI001367CDB6|nr:MFS transporter [Pseudomaricurvus sp. HS19]MYM62358.1 MFS transporter [Pseudomaricurvus sp. HS19]